MVAYFEIRTVEDLARAVSRPDEVVVPAEVGEVFGAGSV